MQDKLMPQMLDVLRGSPLTRPDSIELILLALVWMKLSAQTTIPQELQLTPELLGEPNRAKETLIRLCDSHGSGLGKVSESKWINRLDPIVLRTILDHVFRMNEAGLLKNLDAAEIAYAIGPLSYRDEATIPVEVAALFIRLAKIAACNSVYIPWDQRGQLAAMAAKMEADVSIETPVHSTIPSLISMLAQKPFRVHYSDPIESPSFIEDGKPFRFDIAVAYPPFGLRYDAKAVERDWFGRFPERTSSGSVLAIRHLISQARNRVVVAVPSTLLFSSGAEQSLREDLVKKGMVQTIIDMPSGLFTSTTIPFAILVLDPAGGHDEVKFIKADSIEFRNRLSKTRNRLTNVDALVELVFEDTKSEWVTVVSTADVLKRASFLIVGAYVLPSASKKILELVETEESRQLRELVTTVRPIPTTMAGSDTIEAKEIGAADLPPFGYIASPNRTVFIERRTAEDNADQFLRPFDIVLIIKGSVGKVGIVPVDVPPAGCGGWVAGQSAIVLRSKANEIDPRAMAVQIRSERGQEVLKFAITGATIPLIPLKMLMTLPVFIPDLKTTEKAVKALEDETRIQAEVDRLRQSQAEAAQGLWNL